MFLHYTTLSEKIIMINNTTGICDSNDTLYIVSIAGVSGAGKSVLAESLGNMAECYTWKQAT